MVNFCDFAKLAIDPGAVRGLLTWPTFSVTSYLMVSGLSKQGLKPKTVIDVGANIGQFAVAAAKLWPDCKVLSFEPQQDCFMRLQRCSESISSIQAFNLALGSENAMRPLHINAHHHSSSFLPLAESHLAAFPRATETGTAMAQIRTLDDVIADEVLVGTTLLKIDVQGYESLVLEGARRTLQSTDFVVLETSFKPLYQGEKLYCEIVEIMRGYGFIFLRPVGFLSDKIASEVIQIDALFKRQ